MEPASPPGMLTPVTRQAWWSPCPWGRQVQMAVLPVPQVVPSCPHPVSGVGAAPGLRLSVVCQHGPGASSRAPRSAPIPSSPRRGQPCRRPLPHARPHLQPKAALRAAAQVLQTQTQRTECQPPESQHPEHALAKKWRGGTTLEDVTPSLGQAPGTETHSCPSSPDQDTGTGRPVQGHHCATRVGQAARPTQPPELYSTSGVRCPA